MITDIIEKYKIGDIKDRELYNSLLLILEEYEKEYDFEI